jgi:hypothetical protein
MLSISYKAQLSVPVPPVCIKSRLDVRVPFDLRGTAVAGMKGTIVIYTRSKLELHV